VSELKQLLGNDYHPDLESGGRDLVRTSAMMEGRDLAYVPGEGPAPVWFMSYPETGITFFMHLLQKSSGYTTATNYGNVLMDEAGVLVGSVDSTTIYPNGPALYSPDLPLPEEFVAVRTHAEGFCFWCHPEQYDFDVEEFYQAASKGYRMINGNMQMYSYNPADVEKMIHLVRDPFDTVVARYYSYVQLVNKGTIDKLRGEADLKFEVSDFKRWCNRMDSTFQASEDAVLSAEQRERGRRTPCRQEFLKIIKFHDNVLQMVDQHNIDRLVVKFENYVTRTDNTVTKVNNFLNYPTNTRNMKTPFGTSGIWMFKNFFTDQERVLVSNFIRFEASATLWHHLNMYTQL